MRFTLECEAREQDQSVRVEEEILPPVDERRDNINDEHSPRRRDVQARNEQNQDPVEQVVQERTDPEGDDHSRPIGGDEATIRDMKLRTRQSLINLGFVLNPNREPHPNTSTKGGEESRTSGNKKRKKEKVLQEITNPV